MVDRPKGVFVIVFLLLGIFVFIMPISQRFFGAVSIPPAELLDAFKESEEQVRTPPIAANSAPVVSASSVMVYDPIHDVVIFEKKSNQKAGIASLTKIMTALVAYEHIGGGERIPISRDAVRTEGTDGNLVVGEHLVLQDLIALMLISSSNDAAVAIAEQVGTLYGAGSFEESQRIFTRMMNDQARALGLLHTTFHNPTGLDLDENALIVSNTSTARDLAFLMKHVMEIPALREMYSVIGTTIYSEERIPHSVMTTNELLVTVPGVLGGKTGFTDAAGGALVTVAEVPLGTLSIVVILGSTRADRFADTATLLEWLRST